MRLEKELDKIKNEKDEETKLKKLQELCNDEATLNASLDIAKHESTLHTPLFAFAVGIIVFDLTFLITDKFGRYFFIFLFVIVLFLTWREFKNWTIVYYDLIEIRRNKIINKSKTMSEEQSV